MALYRIHHEEYIIIENTGIHAQVRTHEHIGPIISGLRGKNNNI